MIPNYRTFTLTATAEDDIVKLIYEELKKEGYKIYTEEKYPGKL